MASRQTPAGTFVNGRQYAVAHQGTTIEFECATAGHRYQEDFGVRPVAQRLGPTGVALMASWWSRARGGCIGTCPQCQKKT